MYTLLAVSAEKVLGLFDCDSHSIDHNEQRIFGYLTTMIGNNKHERPTELPKIYHWQFCLHC